MVSELEKQQKSEKHPRCKEFTLMSPAHTYLIDALVCDTSIYSSFPKCEICHDSLSYEKVGKKQE